MIVRIKMIITMQMKKKKSTPPTVRKLRGSVRATTRIKPKQREYRSTCKNCSKKKLQKKKKALCVCVKHLCLSLFSSSSFFLSFHNTHTTYTHTHKHAHTTHTHNTHTHTHTHIKPTLVELRAEGVRRQNAFMQPRPTVSGGCETMKPSSECFMPEPIIRYMMLSKNLCTLKQQQ